MRRIGEEFRADVGTLGTVATNLTTEQARNFGADLIELKGRTRLEFVAMDSSANSLGRFRVGFQPQPDALEWADDIERRKMNCAGLSPALLVSETDGSAAARHSADSSRPSRRTSDGSFHRKPA